jgi:hypothetical protein
LQKTLFAEMLLAGILLAKSLWEKAQKISMQSETERKVAACKERLAKVMLAQVLLAKTLQSFSGPTSCVLKFSAPAKTLFPVTGSQVSAVLLVKLLLRARITLPGGGQHPGAEPVVGVSCA